MVGSPSGAGFSEKQKAVAPFAAQRSISSAASGGSHIGISINGMYRPGALPHHSSIIQSLYAWRHTNPNSRSLASMNSCPQKRVMVGKHSDASTPARSMSSRRATES